MKNTIKTTILAILMLVCFVGVSCTSSNTNVINDASAITDSTTNSTTNSNTEVVTTSGTYSSFLDGWITDEEAIATVTPASDQVPSTYNASDYEYTTSEYTKVEIDLSNLQSSYADGEVTVEAKSKKTTITLSSDSKYNIVLSGSSNVGVTVVSENDFVLTLNNVSITSKDESDEQALKTKNSSTCFLVLVGESTLTGCTDSTGETTTNAVKASGSLVISGDGTLNVIGNTKHGIVSDDVVCIQSGTVNVTLNPETSSGTGIKPVNGYVQNGGTVNITALNLTEGCETKGIKVDGDEEETEYGAGKGYILINGGILTIESAGKGLTAGFNPTEDGDTTSSVNDPSADVFINNGLITITTYATPREDTYTNGVSNDDGVSPEGIEGKHSVTINGGKIVLNTTDDCINTSTSDSSIVINGGLIYAHSSANDSVDSNGTIVMNGGILIALGAGAPEGGIDCDEDNRFTYTGGTIIAMGGSNQIPQGTGTTGYVLTTGFAMGMGGMQGGMQGPQGMGNMPSNGTQPGMPSNMQGGTQPEMPSNIQGDMQPEMPSNMQGDMQGGMPSAPQGMPANGMPANGMPSAPQGSFGQGAFNPGSFEQGSLSQGSVLAVVDNEGNVILAFTVPEGCVTSNVLIASDAFENGSIVYYTGNGSIESSDYTFANSLALGNVTLTVSDAVQATISSNATTISL